MKEKDAQSVFVFLEYLFSFEDEVVATTVGIGLFALLYMPMIQAVHGKSDEQENKFFLCIYMYC